MIGELLPDIRTAVPGPEVRGWIDRLAAVECPAITARRTRRLGAGGRDPIVWAEARGANVVDVDANRYVDLSGGFGVAAVGHRHPKVVEAIEGATRSLVHAMGDIFPSREKILLGERLAEVTPDELQHSILGTSGADAVEAAIKTALVATGRSRVLAFVGGYHGMSLGALGVSGHRDAFRQPFASFAGRVELRLPYGACHDCAIGLSWPKCDLACLDMIEWMLGSDVAGAEDVAAVIVEPIQGRGGDIVPPDRWLRRLRRVTERLGILLIVDEIYTGFGRTGAWFACDHDQVLPDIICVGKAMGGGLPISACVGSAAVMEAWGESAGEAMHTSTFLGHPLNCAAALATIDVIEHEGLIDRAEEAGERFKRDLLHAIGSHPRVGAIRGRGMMIGVALLDHAGERWIGGGVTAMHMLLEAGFITSPGGPDGDVICLSPPYVTTDEQLAAAVDALSAWLETLR